MLREKLEAAGYRIVPFGEAADLGIINTCTVTAQADSKCRQVIRGFTKRNPAAYTVVVGCYSQSGSAEIAGIPGVDLILGNQDKLNVLDYLGDRVKQPHPVIVRDRIDRRDFSISFAGERPFNKRANLKVQDGCDFMCSFCIIPFVRGRARSRDFANLLEEARAQVARGVRELVLTGVNIGTYAQGGATILEVVDALAAIEGLWRVRVSSIEPTTVPLELLDRMRDPAHALQPFLHIPLQSGSNRILSAMRRRHTVEEWRAFIAMAAARVPGLYVGTDVMVGYPGESPEDFAATCRAIDEGPVAFAHVFTYSEREGTLAARSAQHVAPAERHRRSAILRSHAQRKRRGFCENFLGRKLEVLFEDPREGTAPGLTENYIRVVTQPDGWDPAELANRTGIVALQKVKADFVEGELLELTA